MSKPHKPCCPRDGNALEPIEKNGGQAMGCRMCGGLWISKSQFDGRVDPETSRRLFHGASGRATDMRCPADGGLLFEFQVHGVLLDRCNHCGGLWFDAGELRAVLGPVVLGAREIQKRRDSPYLDDSPWWMEVPGAGELVVGLIALIFSP